MENSYESINNLVEILKKENHSFIKLNSNKIIFNLEVFYNNADDYIIDAIDLMCNLLSFDLSESKISKLDFDSLLDICKFLTLSYLNTFDDYIEYSIFITEKLFTQFKNIYIDFFDQIVDYYDKYKDKDVFVGLCATLLRLIDDMVINDEVRIVRSILNDRIDIITDKIIDNFKETSPYDVNDLTNIYIELVENLKRFEKVNPVISFLSIL